MLASVLRIPMGDATPAAAVNSGAGAYGECGTARMTPPVFLRLTRSATLQPYFDWALNEECWANNECTTAQTGYGHDE